MDRETKELLTSIEKMIARTLTDLSTILATDAGKVDARTDAVRDTTTAAGILVVSAQQKTTSAMRWLVVVAVAGVAAEVIEIWHRW